MIVKEDLFKGHTMFQVFENEDDKFPKFSCGIRKAQIIVEHYEELKAFVTKHGETKVEKPKKAKDG